MFGLNNAQLIGRLGADVTVDIPEREDIPVDIDMGSTAAGMEEREAVARRTVPAAPGQVEDIMPILDEPVEHAGAMRDGGHFE